MSVQVFSYVGNDDPLINSVVFLLKSNGTTAVDKSAYGVTLTQGTGVTIDTVNGKFGDPCFNFTATSGAITVPYLASKFDLAQTVTVWTVEAFVNLTGAQSSIATQRIDVAGNQSGSQGWEAAISTTYLGVIYPGYGGPTVTQSLTSGTWHHIVWQRNGTSYSFGLNGSIINAQTNTQGNKANTTMKIGGNLTNSTGIAYKLQDVRISTVNRYPMTSGSTYTVPTAGLPVAN